MIFPPWLEHLQIKSMNPALNTNRTLPAENHHSPWSQIRHAIPEHRDRLLRSQCVGNHAGSREKLTGSKTF